MSEKLFEESLEAILKGDAEKASRIGKTALDEVIDPLELMDRGFVTGPTKWAILLNLDGRSQ